MQSPQQFQQSPFHEGEHLVQSRLGIREEIEPWARRVVRPYMPQPHRDFYTKLPFVVAVARDVDDRPWVTLLVGPPGFVQSQDDRSLSFATNLIRGDALESAFGPGAELGLLGIELETRRRNRVNGKITELGASGFRFEVGQAFGNCPQYITERTWREVDVDQAGITSSRHRKLDSDMQAWISAADTLFVGSGYRGNDGSSEAYGMDASHRGGAPGFVKVLSENRLVFPDYAGNNHFNTIGNLVMNSGVGLLFVDFESGSLLQLTGKASIDWNSKEVGKYPGAQRLVIIDIEEIVRLEGVLPLRWSAPEGSVRSLRVARKIVESDDVMSFEFIARDGGELPDFEAGQHLPIELEIGTHDQSARRTYSLSNGPGQGLYRISVKREPQGLFSRYLHDNVSEGDIINSRKPDGEFVLAHSGKPVALISAGIGVTPMLSMLQAIAAEDKNRRVHFIHGARDGAHHPLADEALALAAANDNITLNVSYSHPHAKDIEGEDYDRRGRVDADLISELIPSLDADFYLCGPPRFLADISAALADRGVDPAQVRAETFAGRGRTSVSR